MFPDALEFHVAPWIQDGLAWLVARGGGFFHGVSVAITRALHAIEAGLLAVPWWLWIAGVLVAAWAVTRRPLTAVTLAGLMLAIGAFGYWEAAIETLAMVIVAVVLAVAFGVPLGIAMAESRRVHALVIPVLDAMQTMPSFVYLIPVMMLFQALGPVPGTLATVVYALPPVARLVDLGIRQVPADAQEAARAFGATRWQLLAQVRLPLALPSIMAGINQTTMMALAMVVVASMVGAGGVGEAVMRAIQRVDPGAGFEAGFTIVALAIVMDRLSQGLARRWQVPRTG
ncbi:binding-protein-dependent transport systems inner membrane component [Thermaerobacter marianensis DSM 12885]|uniref:Binding-protein-dependent transport systems inner membrane component n=1 Tax=Thermaerobacter marianensis (strain ATCC 700841 / DSM 12885 / JCM 10246 / 7p75a) TaxID=644966 RepID=E6SHA7_THEM7|nr:ABC transporter permease subunit [Thermaerobacter marianensis]ADU50671.1 binding-protein-dependent transport systems inner membrane component [Thermaerobacter marianensis DSM 12885]